MTNSARTGQTLLIAASSMFFAAFTSAMVVRRGLGGDWVAPELPSWIWVSLVLAPLTSWLIHRQKINAVIVLGSALVSLQIALLAHLQMAVVGEAFLSVLVAAHAAHAAAGVVALVRFGANAGFFWHFVGALWIYILFLFGVWA